MLDWVYGRGMAQWAWSTELPREPEPGVVELLAEMAAEHAPAGAVLADTQVHKCWFRVVDIDDEGDITTTTEEPLPWAVRFAFEVA